ncbi:GNAT family N-acetyltransferase [Nocardioides flavescens]|uniref:GNAT family N-acetyltransferase n=1 Tax=Nocardioides flavescens TaxID=2691959 RepID=A0A6L7ERE4_9ACTN|nr:GNAT family N-acetyltransferase [Nocardioides flavescens]
MVSINEHGQPVGDEVPGWAGCPWPEPVRLGGRHVVVDPLALDHAPALFAALCGAEDHALWTYRATEPPATVEDMTDLVRRDLEDPSTVTFVLRPDGGEPAGLASYLRIDAASGSIEIGSILFARSLQRTAAATEAVHLLMRHALEDLGYRRFEWKCDALNEPSRRAAERFGFTHEGRFRQHLVVKGRNRDTDWYAVTDADWPAVRREHERWLDPANFDAEGRQRSRLRVVG